MAIWDTLKNLLTGAGGAVGDFVTNAKVNAYKNSLAPTPQVTTAAQRAAMQKPTTPSAQVPSNYSSSYSAGYSPVNYASTRQAAAANVGAAYDPLKTLLENEINKGIPGRYKESIKTTEKRLPLNQQRYQNLLDQLEASDVAATKNIKEQEDIGLGGARARAGARGLYDSSVLAGGEQRISKQAMDALLAQAGEKTLKQEQYSSERALDDQAVYEALASLYNQREGEVSGVRSQLAGIPIEMLGGINNEVANALNAAQVNISGSSSSGANKGVFRDYIDPETGDIRSGYFVDGQLVSDAGTPVPETGAERTSYLLGNMLQKYLTDSELSPEEVRDLQQQFPFEGETIAALAKQYQPKGKGFLGLF